ncbi:MAG TPA: hypothetical protein VLW49_03500 [Gaiellaceae bacterium]|nr:hypothetical protein [Gaiellaceae bacterium]
MSDANVWSGERLGDGSCRYLTASSRQMPEVCECPELGQITAQAPTGSQTGERLWLIYDVPKPTE